MVRPTKYDQLAADAAARVQRAHQSGEQLTFLADEKPVAGRDPAAAKRGPGKAVSQMREFLAAKGYRQPEDVMVEMAGLNTGETLLVGAMREAEEILLFGQDGAAKVGKEGAKKRPKPTMSQRIAVLDQVLARRFRSNDALLPYGLAKVSGDINVTIPTQIVMPGAPAPAPGTTARDITPVADRRMAPPPMPNEMQQNQSLSKTDPDNPDRKARTE